MDQHAKGDVEGVDSKYLRSGQNVIAIVTIPLRKAQEWDVLNTDPGLLQFTGPHRFGKGTVITLTSQANGLNKKVMLYAPASRIFNTCLYHYDKQVDC